MGTYKKLRTPIIKPRAQGGTFYTFSSAMEDIGLNINELKNKVALSHYVLLEIPAFSALNTYGDGTNQGDYSFAEMFENYALNMETVLRNQPTYNFAESLSVSERVFWKFMKHYNFMKFKKDENNPEYYIEDSSVVKGYGLITAGAQRTDEYGIYNETFVQIPSSYGRMKTLFKPVSDKNYHITTSETAYFTSENTTGFIENVQADEIDKNKKLHTGIPAAAIYDKGSSYTVMSEDEELCAEFSLSELRNYFGIDSLTYDDIAINGYGLTDDAKDAPYTFNAILLYYSIYDSTTKNILATNAYGLMILDSATNDGDNFVFPAVEKRKTTTSHNGNSYSFRLNVKTSSVYSGDTTVYDNSTAAYEMSTEFNDVLRNLSAAVETLRSNANLIASISTDNFTIKQLALQTIGKVEDIEKNINLIKSGKVRKVNADTVHTVNLSTNNIDASTKFLDDSGNIVGSIDGSAFTYDTAKFNAVESKTVKGDVETSKVAATSDNSVVVCDNTQTEIFAKFSENGVHANKDFTYANHVKAFKGTNAISEGEVNTFFKNINIGYDDTDGFVFKLNEDTGASVLLDAVISSGDTSKCSVAGLLALIVAKLKLLENSKVTEPDTPEPPTDATDKDNAQETTE